jgi:hypothetical protein
MGLLVTGVTVGVVGTLLIAMGMPEAVVWAGGAGLGLLMVGASVTHLLARVYVSIDDEAVVVSWSPVPFPPDRVYARREVLGFVTHRHAITNTDEHGIPEFVRHAWDVEVHLRGGDLVPVVTDLDSGEEAAALRRELERGLASVG